MELRFVQLAFLLAFCSWEVTLGFQHSPSAASVRSFGTAPRISSFPRSVLSRIPMVVGDQPLDWTPDQGFQGSRVRRYFARPSDGLTFKQRLTKMGLAAALSYGWVSNMSYSVTVSLAWYISCKRTGLSPLAPGEWKGFLAVYSGFYIFNNIIRPARLAVSVAISPKFDDVVANIQKRFNVNRATAITITVVIANVFGTIFFMSMGILLASTLAGVPIFVPK